MTRKRPRELKLMYVAGTQDPHRAFQHLRNGIADPEALFTPYIRQFLHLCDDLDAAGVVVSTRPPKATTSAERHVFYNMPNPLASAPGLLYDLGQVVYGLRVALIAARHHPDLIIVNDGVMHLVTLPLLRMAHTKVVLAFHNTLWAELSPREDRWKRIARLCRRVFTDDASGILSASYAIKDNLLEATSGRCSPIHEFLPTYDINTFSHHERDNIEPDTKFRVLYAGRIMPSKGIFDFLRMAAALKDAGLDDCAFTMCGQGWAEDELRLAIKRLGLADCVTFVGQRDATALLELYRRSDVVVVPTTSAFREGFNQVVAEAALAGTRVVTSRACPAARYFAENVVVVEPDDLGGYISALKDAYLQAKTVSPVREIRQADKRFFDSAFGWHGQAEALVKSLVPSATVNQQTTARDE